MGSSEETNDWDEKEFLYTVLNLPVTAAPHEIRERYRALSVVFHPDKQRGGERDARAKETAVRRFYEIQRAHEVLSDPFLRVVYDTLGNEGLKLKFPPTMRDMPPDELKKALTDVGAAMRVERVESRVRAKGWFTCGVDASDVFAPQRGGAARAWYTDVPARLRDARLIAFGVRHSFEQNINAQTKATVVGRMDQVVGDVDDDDELGMRRLPLAGRTAALRLRGNVTGIIRHQYSPKLHIEASANLLRRHALALTASYTDGANTVSAQTSLGPRPLRALQPPPLTLTLARRLFRTSPVQGTLALALAHGAPPGVTLGVSRPSVAGAGARVVTAWACGVNLRTYGAGPGVSAEWGIGVPELQLQLKVGASAGVMGLVGHAGGEWASADGEAGVAAHVNLETSGVMIRLTLSYLGQTLLLPFVISTEYDPRMALIATVIPSAAFVIGNHFFLKPRRLARRIARRRAILRNNDEQVSQKKREAEESALLLREIAKKHMQVESERDGLVILEASYVAVDETGTGMEVGVDVTIAVQALVQNGQLYIAGNRSKAGLQGFYDPLPESKKVLRSFYHYKNML